MQKVKKQKPILMDVGNVYKPYEAHNLLYWFVEIFF